MASMSLNDAMASSRTVGDIANAIASILNQLNQFLLIENQRLASAETEEEKNLLEENIQKLVELKAKQERDPSYLKTPEEEKLCGQFFWRDMDDKYYTTTLEYLEKAKAQGIIRAYAIDINTEKKSFVVYGHTEDSTKISEMETKIINSQYNRQILSAKQLEDMAKARYDGKEAKVIALVSKDDEKGLTISDLELLKKSGHDFRYHVGKDSEGRDAIFILDRDKARLERELLKNRIILSSRSKEAMILDRAMHEKELYENLNIRNGKNVYMCCPDTDMCIKIGDDTFEVLKGGKSIDLGIKGQKEELIEGEIHYSNLKHGNEVILDEYIKMARQPIILEENEFIRDFEQRQEVMRNKLEMEIQKTGTFDIETERELDKLFDPNVNYTIYEPSKNVQEWLKLAHPELEEEKARDDGSTWKEWYEKKKLEHEKLNLDKSDIHGLSGKTAEIYEFSQKIIEARENNTLNNEYKKNLIEEYKLLDLDEKEDMIKILTGMTPEEVKSISSHIDDYIEENSLENHIEFVEVTDDRVANYWHNDRNTKEEPNYDELRKEIDRENQEMRDLEEYRGGDGDLNGNYLEDNEEEYDDLNI